MGHEVKSSWDCVYQKLDQMTPLLVEAEEYLDYPESLLFRMSYYKFAAKMIGSKKRVLDLNALYGFGSWLISKECGYCYGVTEQETAVENFLDEQIDFAPTEPDDLWDAVVSFDVLPEKKWSQLLKPYGVAVIGSSQPFSEKFFQQELHFSAIGELIVCGRRAAADYFLIVGCGC